MHFPVSGVDVSPLVPPLVAFVVSFFASMGGISGAFLLLPFQVSVLGYTHPSVSATNQFYNVVAIPSGVYRYIKEKRMVWPLTIMVVLGTLPGVFLGAIIRIVWLPDPKLFKLFVGCVLLYIGGKLIQSLLSKPSLTSEQQSGTPAAQANPTQASKDMTATKPTQPTAATQGHIEHGFVDVLEFSRTRIAYYFKGALYECSTTGIFVLSLIVGVIGGAYGIGGGAIIAPFLLSWFRLPVHTISGATLMGTFITSVTGVLFYSAIAPFFPQYSVAPDWTLGLLFGIGGVAGMYLGARCQKFVSATLIKWMLGIVIVSTAAKYIWEYFL